MRRLKQTWTLVAALAAWPAAVADAQDAYTATPATYETPAQQIPTGQAEAGANRSAGEPPAVLRNAPVPLRRPELSTGNTRQSQDERGNSPLTVIGSLGLVLGLFFAVTWLFKRRMPGGMFLLPREALEVLGKAALGTRQQVQLIRVGHKLLLVAVTPAGIQTLTEITDPSEIAHLIRICHGTAPATTDANAGGDASRRSARSNAKRRAAAKSDVFEPSLAGGRNA